MLRYLKRQGFVPHHAEEGHGEGWAPIEHLFFYFENGYGASVIHAAYSSGRRDGLWELAVLKKDDVTGQYEINYATSITDNVLRYLTKEDVASYLSKIKELGK